MPKPKTNLNLEFLKRPLRDRLLYSYMSQFNSKEENMNRGKSIQFWLPTGKTKSSKPSKLKLLHHANHWKIDIIDYQ